MDTLVIRSCLAAGLTLSLAGLPTRTARAQVTGPGLVVPVPAAARVSVRADSFTPSTGQRRVFRVYRPAGVRGRLPLVVFANSGDADFNTWQGYVDWARLTTTRGMAAVLYPGPSYDPQRPFIDHVFKSMADLDSVIAVLTRDGQALGVDATNLVIWAGSSQTSTGTPFALLGSRPGIRGYVLYYGTGFADQPRTDVPVLVVRAGLDSPQLNRGLDSLTERLTRAGAPITVVSHPSGPHGFDVQDSTEATARVIATTLDFMAAVVEPRYHAAIIAGAPAARASAAFAAGRWVEAERIYAELGRANPASRVVAWRLGLAQLEAGHPADALASLDRAKALGQGGARDIGLPAARAALRAGETTRAAEWVKWALENFPPIRSEIGADSELAPLLDHAVVRGAPRPPGEDG
jgi:hypothetical protein